MSPFCELIAKRMTPYPFPLHQCIEKRCSLYYFIKCLTAFWGRIDWKLSMKPSSRLLNKAAMWTRCRRHWQSLNLQRKLGTLRVNYSNSRCFWEYTGFFFFWPVQLIDSSFLLQILKLSCCLSHKRGVPRNKPWNLHFPTFSKSLFPWPGMMPVPWAIKGTAVAMN